MVRNEGADTLGDEKPVEAPEATSAPPPEAPRKKQRRGFAAMDPEKVRAIAKKGGIAVHVKGTAHSFTPDEAREAGKKGGMAPHRIRGRQRKPKPESSAAPPTAGPAHPHGHEA